MKANIYDKQYEYFLTPFLQLVNLVIITKLHNLRWLGLAMVEKLS